MRAKSSWSFSTISYNHFAKGTKLPASKSAALLHLRLLIAISSITVTVKAGTP
jgi:hypothetical protein